MTKARKTDLEKLSTFELNNLFLKESQVFLGLLDDDTNSTELMIIKERVREIMEILDQRKKDEEL